ncbi:uncharacterized protein [Atheta coriaria]|uniref:uncharacterized protein isoform X2 n=1 Tax=Dalotia coriaria TaxID=877792 RepID=UPI0031F47027
MSKVGTSKYLKNNGFVMMMSSIMASDSSPTADNKEFSYPAPGRSTPPPTTSYVSARQESQAIAIDQNIAKPIPEKETDDLKEKDAKEKEKDDVDMSAPDANPGYKPEERKDDKRDFKEDKGGGGGDTKLNGGSKLETAFMLPLDAKDDEVEEESCTVNCLYYTMQCCECVIT